MHILYIGPCMPEYVALLEELKPEGSILTALPVDDAACWRALPDADFLLTLGPVTADMIASAARLKLIQVAGIGCERVDVQAAARAGVPVATTAGSNALSVAEHAMALILTLWRQIPYADGGIRAGKWLQLEFYRGRTRELAGKTLGLVGFGHVGRALARRATGFDLKILYCARRRLTPGVEVELGVSYVTLDELLGAADIVSLQVPLTLETRGLIGREALALMKRGAVLVSTCRGGVIDEAALLDSLHAGHLGGVGLDVFEIEPLPADSPWRSTRLDNVVLTPHVAGASQEAVRRTFRMAFENVVRVAAGQDPLNRVN